MSARRIPVAAPDLGGNEERYAVEAIRSSWISSTGPFVDRFEREFAALCGTRAAVSVCNGTAALHLALAALGIGPGDEVIVPSLTYIATANACRYVGAEPVFVDADPATWCLDPALIERALSPRTRAIIAVHLFGHPADMDAINVLAAARGLAVIEDAAEAPTATYKSRPVGGLGRIATFSFYGNKIFTSGEGGALTLDDPALEARVRLLRGQGMDPARRYFFPVTGFNYRLTNVACALLCAQLERADELLAQRRRVIARYEARLRGVAGLSLQPRAAWAQVAPWVMGVRVEPGFGATRDEVAARLAAAGVETRPFFIPVHTLPPFVAESQRRGEVLPVTDRLGAEGLILPTYAALTDEEIDTVCDQLEVARSWSAPAEEIEFSPVAPEHAAALAELFAALVAAGDEKFFHPHPLDAATAERIARRSGADCYGVARIGGVAVGYGMLRGWEEGYAVPSLGLAVHPAWRGRGLGRRLMARLHALAGERGAERVRLSVHPDNTAAVALYRSLGYALTAETPERWIGVLDLAAAM